MKKVLILLLLSLISINAADYNRTYRMLQELCDASVEKEIQIKALQIISDDLYKMRYKTLKEIKHYKKFDNLDACYNMCLYFFNKPEALTKKQRYYGFECLVMAANNHHPKAMTMLGLFLYLSPDSLHEFFPDIPITNADLYIKRAAYAGCKNGAYIYGANLFEKINTHEQLMEDPDTIKDLNTQDFGKLKKAMYWIKKSGFFKLCKELEEEMHYGQ
jgi:TPR repeat protein